MSFTTNIRSFLSPANSDLVNAYLILVGVELALKDAKLGGKFNHDIPGMLNEAAKAPAISAKNGIQVTLRGLAHMLSGSLHAISCVGPDGEIRRVPTSSYPYLRYCRCEGDWAGVGETSALRTAELLRTCKNLHATLKSNAKPLGVKL